MNAPPRELALADLGALANTFGLVPTTPAWSQVEAAMKRLETVASSPGMTASPEDARLVGHYRSVLQASRRQLALGYACAAVLAATAERAGRTVTVSDALRLLSSALLLTQKQPADVLSVLTQSAEDLVALQLPGSAALADLLVDLGSDPEPNALAAAGDVVKSLRRAVAGEHADSNPVDWDILDESGWRALHARAIAWVRRRELQPVRAAEMVGRVAERPLAGALRIHLDRSSAAEWSQALMRGLARVPETKLDRVAAQRWLPAVASVALGLPAALGSRGDRVVLEWLRECTGASGEALSGIASVLDGTATPTGGRLLLLSSNVLEQSLVAQWPPAAGGCTIVLNHDEMRRLLDTGLPRVLQSVQPLRLVLAVEVTGERAPAERALGELAERVGREGAARVLISRERFRSEMAMVVPAPRSAEELFDIVLSQSRREQG